ncbi:YjbH domain-containing protein [Vibrio ostreicida]|uniref:YjbH domain-containing protein n=1 Tax=Vibrio ostreicida TaxID=526588 RepID=UPI00097084C3|nr:YjbH domain-containing protein [Vibrio ostreicida]
MKTNTITSLLFSMGLIFSVDAEPFKVSQMDFGGTGLLQMPSGRMASEGEFNLGVSVNDDYQQYSASIQLMSWLESTVRYTRVPDLLFSNNPSYSGDNLYTDKGIDFKIRLWQEGYWLPETSVGVRDFGGTGLFDGEFVATTKRFGNIDVTLGLGWGYLGQRDNITNPFCKASDKYCSRAGDFKGTGGDVDYERWFKGPAALFGGFEYQTPYRPLRIKLEYDGNDYSQDYPVVRAGKAMPQHTPWNLGLNYRLGDWGDAKVSYQRGDTITFGINLYTNFNDMKAVWRDEAKQATGSGKNVQNTDWKQVAQQIETNAGYQNNEISIDGDAIIVKGQQTKYRDREEALDRTAAILTNHSSELIRVFKVVEQQDGMDLKQTTIRKEAYLKAANHLSTETKISDSFKDSEPKYLASSPVAESKKRWDYGFEPVLKQSLGGPEAFYLYSLGIGANSHYWLTDNLEFGGSIIFNLVDNYDKFNYIDNSPHISNYSTPRVRTLFRAYVHDNPVRLNHLQLTWFEQPAQSIYTQMYAGYLEMMFAGVGGEVLYRPMNTNWAVGFDANLISQRDPDSWFGVYSDDYFFYDEATCNTSTPSCQAYVLSRGTTGHVTGYYMPSWHFLEDTLFKLSAGKFLGGDLGARLDFSKQFKSGVIVGAYATFTDLTAEEYGEGSYNKGFYVSIPLDIMTIKPSVSRAKISWEPITRDGGQMLNKQYNLFDQTDARSQWYQRPSSVD